MQWFYCHKTPTNTSWNFPAATVGKNTAPCNIYWLSPHHWIATYVWKTPDSDSHTAKAQLSAYGDSQAISSFRRTSVQHPSFQCSKTTTASSGNVVLSAFGTSDLRLHIFSKTWKSILHVISICSALKSSQKIQRPEKTCLHCRNCNQSRQRKIRTDDKWQRSRD